jgi:hypothetical protein
MFFIINSPHILPFKKSPSAVPEKYEIYASTGKPVFEVPSRNQKVEVPFLGVADTALAAPAVKCSKISNTTRIRQR